jgi:hypothetical protein
MRTKKNADLPDLQEQGNADHDIVADNIRAVQAIYSAALLEELKAFQVVDRLVELFQQGVLPIGRGRAGRNLFKYWKESPSRLSETERRSLYARVLGLPGGEADVVPNREFNDLWIRFLSSVAQLNGREQTTESTISKSEKVSAEDIKAAARDLAINLSLHGFGFAGFAATELQKQIDDVIRLLSSPEIRTAYGSRDMWQVIEQVAANELGGARSGVRYRTMLVSGSTVIAWLAKNSRRLKPLAGASIISAKALTGSQRSRGEVRVTTNPTDRDLLEACQQWLAVINQ